MTMPHLLQDADRGLSQWLALRACAICWRARARMANQEAMQP